LLLAVSLFWRPTCFHAAVAQRLCWSLPLHWPDSTAGYGRSHAAAYASKLAGHARGLWSIRDAQAAIAPGATSASNQEQSWVKGFTGALAAVVLAASVVLGAAGRAAAREVDIYFGVGNFYHLQYELVLKEALALERRGPDITSINGYAGGNKVGELDRICYSSALGYPGYAELGHAQVVQLTLPEENITAFAKLFFEEVPKRSASDKGPQFRPSVGLRRGMKSEFFKLIEQANNGSVKLVKGQGDDKGEEGVVYVYDTKYFPFRPAEIMTQFQNNSQEPNYTSDYNALGPVLKTQGQISLTGCPEARLF